LTIGRDVVTLARMISCSGCQALIDPHADNHECPGTLRERIEELEADRREMGASITWLEGEVRELRDELKWLCTGRHTLVPL
jgi:predicted nuclease with TOPRIM domain